MTGVERVDVMVRMHFGPNSGIAFSPDGALLAVCSAHHAEIIDARGGRVLRLIRGHAGPVADVAFSPDGRVIVTGSYDGTARTWETATGTPLRTFTGHAGGLYAVAFSPDGSLLATASGDATARLWDVASGAHLATLVPLPSAGYITLLPGDRYKLGGDPGDCLWWAAGLDRLGPEEVHDRFPEIRRLSPDAPILPLPGECR